MNSSRTTDSTLTSGTRPVITARPSRPSDQVPFTGKHSKALKNSLALSKELETSRSFHAEGIPVLVSSSLLRGRDLGQIDVCRFLKDRRGEWFVEVGEVKSSLVGEENLVRGQRRRLLGSLQFLTGLLGVKGKLTRIVG